MNIAFTLQEQGYLIKNTIQIKQDSVLSLNGNIKESSNRRIFLDIMMEDFCRPSGISIPLFLKRKWEKQAQLKQSDQESSMGEAGEGNDQTTEKGEMKITCINRERRSRACWEPQLRLMPDEELTRDESHQLSNRVFTASELEERIRKTANAMFDIQRQLHRGEEIYYDDTYNHGSIYKGWDAFVDMKDIGTTASSGGVSVQASSNRRVPADARWFSTSCGSVSRTSPPESFPPPLVPSSSLSTENLPVVPEQAAVSSGSDVASQKTKAAVKSTTIPPDSVESLSQSATSTDPKSSSTSIRNSQRGSNAVSTTTSTATRGTETSETNSSATRSSSRPTTPVTKSDPGSTRKKRKSVTGGTSEELPPKKINQKARLEEGKDSSNATSSTPKASPSVTTRGSRSDNNTSPSAEKSNKPETRETPAKRQKETETPVPRKRGRPRRKS